MVLLPDGCRWVAARPARRFPLGCARRLDPPYGLRNTESPDSAATVDRRPTGVRAFISSLVKQHVARMERSDIRGLHPRISLTLHAGYGLSAAEWCAASGTRGPLRRGFRFFTCQTACRPDERLRNREAHPRISLRSMRATVYALCACAAFLQLRFIREGGGFGRPEHSQRFSERRRLAAVSSPLWARGLGARDAHPPVRQCSAGPARGLRPRSAPGALPFSSPRKRGGRAPVGAGAESGRTRACRGTR
jgi:hypothetical protein